MKALEVFKAFCVGCVVLTGVGCATERLTPKPIINVRKGFFDRMSDSVPLSREEKIHLSRPQSRSLARSTADFQWPLRMVQVTSPYGQRGQEYHEGIDLRASYGTPVYASQTGVVLYADSKIRGYGKMVVLRHFGKIATIYAHNSKLLVRRGDRIRQGQKIAISGKSGHVRGAHLHFEIRRGLGSLDPMGYLPHLERRPASLPEQSAASLATSK